MPACGLVPEFPMRDFPRHDDHFQGRRNGRGLVADVEDRLALDDADLVAQIATGHIGIELSATVPSHLRTHGQHHGELPPGGTGAGPMSNARDDSTDDQTTQLVPGGYPATVTGPASPADPPPRPSADTATPRADTEVMPPHPPTEVAHPPTEVAHPPTEVAAPHAVTRTASPHPAAHAAPANAAPPSTAPPGRPTEIVRYGPGVPAPATAAAPAAPTAEEVWRTGRLPGPSHRRARLRRWPARP